MPNGNLWEVSHATTRKNKNMSRDNATKFLELIAEDKTLLARLLDGCASAAAWVTEAARTGFQCSVDELRSVCEQLVGKPVEASSLVGELRNLFEAELDEPALAQVAGGAGSFFFAAERINQISRVSRDPFLLIGPEDWSNDPKIFREGDLNIPDLRNLGDLTRFF